MPITELAGSRSGELPSTVQCQYQALAVQAGLGVQIVGVRLTNPPQ